MINKCHVEIAGLSRYSLLSYCIECLISYKMRNHFIYKTRSLNMELKFIRPRIIANASFLWEGTGLCL